MTDRHRLFPISRLIRLAPVVIAFGGLAVQPGMAGSTNSNHFAANLHGDYAAAKRIGFNLADISSPSDLDDLPEGMQGVLWIGNGYNTKCTWRVSDDQVVKAVEAARGHPRFSGIYYIADEPHPANCPDAAHKVTERTKLIHSLDPAARTFILIQNGSQGQNEFEHLADAADLIGVDPYPCNQKNAEKGCDLKAMRERIEAALAAGIRPDRIVPVFQVFGQECTTAATPYYRLPSVAETKAMLSIWDELIPRDRRPFDMTYSWGTQTRSACPTLKMADGGEHPDLLSVYSDYFAGAVFRRVAHD